MNANLKFITAFALAYLADYSMHKNLPDDLEETLRSIATEVDDFTDHFVGEDTQEVVVKEFIQAYNNLKIAVEEYEALEREG